MSVPRHRSPGSNPRRGARPAAVLAAAAGAGAAALLVERLRFSRLIRAEVHPDLRVPCLVVPPAIALGRQLIRAARRLRGAQAPRTRGRILWSRGLDRLGWAAYLHGRGGAGPRSARPYSVPGRRPDLSGMPPTWIGVGNLDLFRDDAVAYAGRLRRAGAECELVVVPSMYHAADRVAPRARACATSAARWSRTCAATWRRARQCLRRERQGARARPPVPASSKLPF